jgi:hypothetical protein
VPWWGFVLVILAVAGITCGLWGVVLVSRGDASTSTGPTPTPIFVVITATATLGAAPGPVVVTTTPPAAGPTTPPTGITPTAGAASTSAPGVGATSTHTTPIAQGVTVVIAGTSGLGLNVRQGPGTDYTILFTAKDGDKFTVKDGPRQADGYTWWYIVDPNDQNRFGWAVQDNMQVVP